MDIQSNNTIPVKTEKDFEELFPEIIKFLRQSTSEKVSTATKGYITKFKGLNVEISFGQTIPANVTWICFLKEGQNIQNGYYPGLYFDRETSQLFVVLGVSETQTPNQTWPIEFTSKYSTFGKIDESEKIKKKYKSSFRFSPPYKIDKHNIEKSLESEKERLFSELNLLIQIYKKPNPQKDDGPVDSIIISKIAWSYNGWTGFDIEGYNNRAKYGYKHIKDFGLAHEWWMFHDFGDENYLGHIETGTRGVNAFKNNGLILIASTNPEEKEFYLVGFYGKAEWGEYSLPTSLWETLSIDDKETLKQDAGLGLIDKNGPEELRERTTLNWRGKKEYSTLFKKFIPFEPKDFGVNPWGRAPYIGVGQKPGIFTKDSTKELLVKALDEHKNLLINSKDSEKTEIESIIGKIERILEMYFEKTNSRNYWQIAPNAGAKDWGLCVEKGIIGIYFKEYLQNPNNEVLNYSWDELIDFCQKNNPAASTGQVSANVEMIWNFLHKVQVGDYILANKGKRQALGWGIIASKPKISTDNQELTFYRDVDWKNTALNRDLDYEQGKNFFRTIYRMTKEHFESIISVKNDDNPQFSRIQNVLDYKKQVILYGPPGTGKTWVAANFIKSKKIPEIITRDIAGKDRKFFWYSVLDVGADDLADYLRNNEGDPEESGFIATFPMPMER